MPEVTLTPDRTPAGWGQVAAAYDTHIASFTVLYAADLLDAVRVRKDDRLLDVAAGSGAVALLAAARGADVVATDFAPEMIALLQQRARAARHRVDARVMDAQDLDLPDAAFDVAVSGFGLMFVPRPARAMAEMARVLRPGGRFAATVWNVPARSPMFQIMFDAIHDAAPDLPAPPAPPAIFSLADPELILQLMTDAGFRDVKVRPVVHRFEADSAEHAWQRATTSNPVIPGLIATVGPDRAEALREAYLERARASTSNGRVSLSAEAHLITARV